MAGILPLASTAAIVRSRGPVLPATRESSLTVPRSLRATQHGQVVREIEDAVPGRHASSSHPSVKSPQRQVTRRSWDVGVGYVGPHLGHERPHRSGTTTVTSGPSSAQLSNRTRPNVTGRACLLGLSGTEVITPPGLIFGRTGRLPHRAGGGPPVQIVVAKVLAAAPGQQTGSNRYP
jgi:hypothetical protein